MHAKPLVAVDLSPEGHCPLVAFLALASVDATSFFHLSRGMRAPPGIYDASIARVCPRVARFCEHIEPLYRGTKIDPARESSVTLAQVAESLEGMLYAAAEHVDDLESIASGFFKTHPLAKRDGRFREFLRSVDKAKKVASKIANKVKHEQARVRLYEIEIRHGGIPASLHGFVIEGANDGVIGPHRAVHSTHSVLSLTTIAWVVLEFVATASAALARFLEHFPKLEVQLPSLQCAQFTDAVKAAARLPTYTFGEPHPFTNTTFRLDGTKDSKAGIDSGIYGSICRRWSESSRMEFGSFAMTTEGDGVSKSFALVSPTNVSLVRWT